jgi:hypothetical protein
VEKTEPALRVGGHGETVGWVGNLLVRSIEAIESVRTRLTRKSENPKRKL